MSIIINEYHTPVEELTAMVAVWHQVQSNINRDEYMIPIHRHFYLFWRQYHKQNNKVRKQLEGRLKALYNCDIKPTARNPYL